ncbi:SET domain-containing protein [Didymella exigua CBS 183.55]|uniref:SET domain-containing protein n=1 Tax=Didymella exigua CBS 183.55 TaxID=1150837 RepID=A0A6A5RFI8_9PLEO|nr:SET domain-containing protein [Didymella exigua CBS 183.55]KAF1927061.1 SET domain-containing protein [Didymella exigua CBS 183.55]
MMFLTQSSILLALTASAFAHGTCPPDVYVVEPSKGKGLGVFALHDLEIGDIVMREAPILKINPPDYVRGSGYPMAQVTELVRKEFETLSADAQAEVMSLTYHATADEEATMEKLGIIFRTNAYNTDEQIGLFPRIARINHSCRPNTSYYWAKKLNRRVVYASRPIKKGEEFFVSYIGLLSTHEQRQNHLNRYGFQCTCSACAADLAIKRASDRRRLEISKAFMDFEPQLTLDVPKSKSARRQAHKNAQAISQLAELVEEEGLADYYAKAYRIAAISHARVEEWQPATIFANKGYRLKHMEDPESAFTAEMYSLTSSFIQSWEAELKNQTSKKVSK